MLIIPALEFPADRQEHQNKFAVEKHCAMVLDQHELLRSRGI